MEEKEVKKGILTDSSGKTSAMRFMCICSLAASIGFGYLTINLETENARETGLLITTVFVFGAFAPKGMQKFLEGVADKKLK